MPPKNLRQLQQRRGRLQQRKQETKQKTYQARKKLNTEQQYVVCLMLECGRVLDLISVSCYCPADLFRLPCRWRIRLTMMLQFIRLPRQYH